MGRKLKLREVKDKGSLSSEVVIIDVLEDANLGRYMLIDTTYNSTNNTISNEHRHSFWFKSIDVKKGDVVYLYTKSGPYTNTPLRGQINKLHSFYWNSGSSIWNNTGDAAVLLELNDWHTLKVN